MDVTSTFKNGVLQVNGNLTDAKKYAKSKDLFFRLRARRVDQTFDPMPLIEMVYLEYMVDHLLEVTV